MEKTVKGLANFPKKNNFTWGKTTRCFNRIHFKSDGSIDYFLYMFNTAIDPEKEKQFDILLNRFIQTYKFGISGSVNFSQYGPVIYND